MALLLEPSSHWKARLTELCLSDGLGINNKDAALKARKLKAKHRSRRMCEIYQSYISMLLYKKVLQDILDSPFFAILFDETTDITVRQQMIVYIRYLERVSPIGKVQNGDTYNQSAVALTIDTVQNSDNQSVVPNNRGWMVPRTRYLGLIRCKGGADSNGLFNLLYHFLFFTAKLDKNKCIGGCTDGASVLVGSKTGVTTKMKNCMNSSLISIHCIAHRLQLASKLSETSVVDQMWFISIVHDLYSHFSKSFSRSESFLNIQTAIGIKCLKLIEPCATRWLALSEAINRINFNMDALMIYTSEYPQFVSSSGQSLFLTVTSKAKTELARRENQDHKELSEAAASLVDIHSADRGDNISSDSSDESSCSDSESSSGSSSSDSEPDSDEPAEPRRGRGARSRESNYNISNLSNGFSKKQKKEKKKSNRQAISQCEADDIVRVQANSSVSSETISAVRLYFRIHSFRFCIWSFAFASVISIFHNLSLQFQKDEILSSDLAPALKKVYSDLAFLCHLDLKDLKLLGSLDNDQANEFFQTWTLNFTNFPSNAKKLWQTANRIASDDPFALSFDFALDQSSHSHTLYFLRGAREDISLFSLSFKKCIFHCLKNLQHHFPDVDNLVSLLDSFSIFDFSEDYSKVSELSKNAASGGIVAVNALMNYRKENIEILHTHFSKKSMITPVVSIDSDTFRTCELGEKETSVPLLSCTLDELLEEWRLVINYVASIVASRSSDSNSDYFKVDSFWCLPTAFQMSPVWDKVQNIIKLVHIFLCLPLSNAPCERGFSILSLIKTRTRNRISTQNLDKLMRILLLSRSMKIDLFNLDYNSLAKNMKRGSATKHREVDQFLKIYNKHS
jgi:hypothetical protein